MSLSEAIFVIARARKRGRDADSAAARDQVSMLVCQAFERQNVQVSLGPRSYEIVIVTQRFDEFAATLLGWMVRRGIAVPARRALIVTDRHLVDSHAAIVSKSLSGSGWKCRLVGLEPGEPSKSLATASMLYDQLVEMRADRSTCIVAVGGGVTGDLAGFVASTYNRGLPYVQVPTSLLAQVDSSVGGKVGINHPQGKNLIGSFYQPLGVFIDTAVLDSLPDRDYRSGLAEVVKYGVILDPEFFEYLEQHVAELRARDAAVLRHIVSRSCRLKADVVEQDEFERTGVRAVLNYGHTFAHAYETLCGYGALTHGEAVAVGMVDAAALAERRGLIDGKLRQRLTALLSALGLPVALPAEARPDPARVLETMRLDKKAEGGELRFVLPTRLGEVKTYRDVPEDDVLAVLRSPPA